MFVVANLYNGGKVSEQVLSLDLPNTESMQEVLVKNEDGDLMCVKVKISVHVELVAKNEENY